MSVTKMDLSIAEKKAYDFLIRQEEAKRWIEELIQESLPPGTANFGDNLRDGIALAKLGKIFAPTAIKKINTPKSGSVLEFMAVDNISQFFEACKKVNFPDHYIFGMCYSSNSFYSNLLCSCCYSTRMMMIICCYSLLADFPRFFSSNHKK